jgi:hypothetical protein
MHARRDSVRFAHPSRALTWKNGCMAWFPALVAFVVAACVGVLFGARVLVKRRQQKLDAARRLSVPLPRIPLRSQVITVQPDALDVDSQAACAAKTREVAVHVDELMALSTHGKATREFLVHQAPTRELSVHPDAEPDEFAKTSPGVYVGAMSPSGLQPRTRLERRAEDDTLKLVEGEMAQAPVASTTAELLRMLGPSPTPDLGNIEVYYRLGLVYLASNQDENARRCFLTVEAISPGYRDAALHLTQLPIYAPTSSGATPAHHTVTTSGYVTAQRDGASAEREPSRGFRKGR